MSRISALNCLSRRDRRALSYCLSSTATDKLGDIVEDPSGAVFGNGPDVLAFGTAVVVDERNSTNRLKQAWAFRRAVWAWPVRHRKPSQPYSCRALE
jgi:hypothetical protein